MNRIEYMRRLAALLQDVPAEERVATMQYYNDYFDDAGEENEEKVIEELGSPEQVAAEMKAGLGRRTEDTGEFRETGYADPKRRKSRFVIPEWEARIRTRGIHIQEELETEASQETDMAIERDRMRIAVSILIRMEAKV